MMTHLSPFASCVRRQVFWNSWQLDLRESPAHLLIDIRRHDCGIASADV